jgi:hypothetical protein
MMTTPQAEPVTLLSEKESCALLSSVSLGRLPLTATAKRRYIRIVPDEITGRRFGFGAEPDQWSEFG